MVRQLRRVRNISKPKTRYLVQEREGQDDVIYIATEALEKRPDMHPISEEEALAFLAECNPGLVYEETEAPEPEVEETGASVIDSLKETVETEKEPTEADFIEVPEPIVPKTDPKNAIDLDTDTDPECQLIRSFTKKNQIEHYLLFTHELEIAVTKDTKLYDLKEEAISAVIAKRL